MTLMSKLTLLALAAAATLSPALTVTEAGGAQGKGTAGRRRTGFVAVAGAGADAATGLPRRVVHEASGVVLVLIPAGEFWMGSPADEAGREENERRHRRLVREPFYLGETEVTVGQFRRFVRATRYLTDAERGAEEGGHHLGAFAATPGGDRDWSAAANWRNPFPNLRWYRRSERHPVVHVSWNDAARFAEHYGLRLPTEAEWEYAARAGAATRFLWGEAEAGGRGYGNVKDAAARRRFPVWSDAFAFDDGVALLADAGRYLPNRWKLRDVVGNVSEWCQDVFGAYPPDGADARAAEGAKDDARVIRGGSWLDAPDFQRPAKRIGFRPQGRRDFIGFRVAASAAVVR